MPPTAEPTPTRAAPAVSVPGEPDELTPAWLTTALAQGGRTPGAVVTDVTAVPVGEDTGFLGRLFRLDLSYDPGGAAGPTTLVAKLPTTDPGGRAVGMMLSVWPREARFYADIAPHLGPVVPTCHYNGADPAAGRWALLLEDGGDPTGVDQLAGATDDQAHAAIDTLAAVHRTWWDVPRPFDWLPGFDRPTFGGLQGAMVEALPAFAERYGDVVPPATLAGLVAFIDALPDWAAHQAAGPLTLAHADYRLDNLLFPPATPGRAVVLDWQTALWAPGAVDLSCFCASSLTIDDRRRLEADLISRYIAGLAADGGPTVALDVILDGYRSALWWWLAIFANNLTRIDTAPGRTRDLFEQVIVRTAAAVADHHPDGDIGPAIG